MVRKIPTQVPATVSRLIESSLIKTPPPWYNAVLANPPPVLPARQVTARSRPGAKGYSDLPASYAPGASAAAHSDPGVAHHKTKFLRQPKIRPAPIVYAADRVRRQFFSDFPFEALRPVSLVEAARVAPEHAVKGAQWTALEQRGAYPTVEDTVAFTLALHEQGVPLSAAYARATDEFVALRAQHEVATLAAAAEARALGAEFKRDDWTRSFDLEQRALDTRWEADNADSIAGALGPRYRKPKMWTASIKPERVPTGEFSAGRQYAQRWRLPAAVQTGTAEGDLVSAIGASSASGSAAPASEEDIDDMELMNSILGTPSAPSA